MARSAPAVSRAPMSPSTYRASAPRSAGTSVASISTRGATTALAPFLGHPGMQRTPRPNRTAPACLRGCPVIMEAYASAKCSTCTYPLTSARGPVPRRARTSTGPRPSAGRSCLAGLDGLQVADGLGQGAHLDQAQPGGDRTLGVGAVRRGGEEDRGARVARADHLLLDAADGLHLAAGGDLPGPGDELAAGQVQRGQLVDDAEGEHHARAGPADVTHVDRDGERELVADRHADQALATRFLGGHPDLLGLALPEDLQGQRGA